MLSSLVCAQKAQWVEGTLLNRNTGEPVPFAHLFNQSFGQGTISNADGYFRLEVTSVTDSIQISSVGFKQRIFQPTEGRTNYTVYLDPVVMVLDQVVVRPDDDGYLYDLLHQCKKARTRTKHNAKAYYELKSYRDESQTELVEGYYNTKLQGNAIDELNLKAGRLALQPLYEKEFFISTESSRAIAMLDVFAEKDHFPLNPLARSKRKMKREFYLRHEQTYLDNNLDSVMVISYMPKENNGEFFRGKVWLNLSTFHPVKITLNCNSAGRHPFLPIIRADKIDNVNLHITQTFETLKNNLFFHHTDFEYEVDYRSRENQDLLKSIHNKEKSQYSIKTAAILYAYDYSNSFFQPLLRLNPAMRDYLSIQALPHNDFFWNNHNEYRMNDSLNSNDSFYHDRASLTDRQLFSPGGVTTHGIYEGVFVPWSPNRIRVREVFHDTTETSATSFKALQYNLEIQLFADLNTYGDSTDIRTVVLFDPYQSYYRLPIDNQTLCFINIYFDLCEILRREMHDELQSVKEFPDRVRELHSDYQSRLEDQKRNYLKSVERGTNQDEVEKFNSYVFEQLGINNLELFQPYSDGEIH